MKLLLHTFYVVWYFSGSRGQDPPKGHGINKMGCKIIKEVKKGLCATHSYIFFLMR